MADFLTVRSATKQFGGLKAVDDVTFDVTEGSLSAIIGPNGAGKTTMFNLIAGAMPVTSGEIRFCGRRIGGPVGAARLGIARTFQNVRLFREMTVIENVLVGMGGDGFLSASVRLPGAVDADRLRMKKAYYLLENLGLQSLVGVKAGGIPFGQQGLLEIARALALGPKLLLLDEPAAGLNRTETTSLSGMIRRICDNGVTVVLVEHDMNLVMNLAERVVVLDGGKRIAEGTPSEVRNDPAVCAAYLGVPKC